MIRFCTLFLFLTASLPLQGEVWETSKGERFEGEFVRIEDGAVVLLVDEEEHKIPILRLSAQFQRRAGRLGARAIEAKKMETSAAPSDSIPELAGFKDAVVTEVKPDHIRITHRHGAATIPFEKIPDELRKKWGLTEEDARRYSEELERARLVKAIADAEIRYLETHGLDLSAAVSKVFSGGVLITRGSVRTGRRVEIDGAEKRVRVDGPTPLSPQRQTVYKTVREASTWKDERLRFRETIFVRCPTRGIIDGEWVAFRMWPAGTYSYESLREGVKTVDMYTTSKEEALAFSKEAD